MSNQIRFKSFMVPCPLDQGAVGQAFFDGDKESSCTIGVAQNIVSRLTDGRKAVLTNAEAEKATSIGIDLKKVGNDTYCAVRTVRLGRTYRMHRVPVTNGHFRDPRASAEWYPTQNFGGF